jgi:hypothetical protein
MICKYVKSELKMACASSCARYVYHDIAIPFRNNVVTCCDDGSCVFRPTIWFQSLAFAQRRRRFYHIMKSLKLLPPHVNALKVTIKSQDLFTKHRVLTNRLLCGVSLVLSQCISSYNFSCEGILG